MVEEIRTYLLNDNSFSDITYIDKNYSPVKLSKLFSEFRNCLLIGNNQTEPEIQVWRADTIIDAIYRDRDLSKIAFKNFDNRRIPSKNLNETNFLPTIKQSFYDDRVLIKLDSETSPQDGIYNKTVSLKKISNNILKVSFKSKYSNLNTDKQLVFTFKGNISNFSYIPETRIRIGLSNCSQIPFDLLQIKIKYPYFFNLNNLIDNINQIGGVEELIWINKKAYEEVFNIYSRTDRPYKKMLCLLLAYAISLKWQ
jgi:hypothetical protein